jgi:hypothetical protein
VVVRYPVHHKPQDILITVQTANALDDELLVRAA